MVDADSEQAMHGRKIAAHLRRHGNVVKEDASIAVPESASASLGSIDLAHLYVPRTIEDEILESFEDKPSNDKASPRIILVRGEAGTGKTSLLWHLSDRLQKKPGYEPWLLKASIFQDSTRERISIDEIEAALDYNARERRTTVLLLDTVDLLLHNEQDRHRLLYLIDAIAESECRPRPRMIMTCRPQEALSLPPKNHDRIFHLSDYDSTELSHAIETHVAYFYERATLRDKEEYRTNLSNLVAAHHSLREVCTRPLTLRMLFVLYAPGQITDEVDVAGLYDAFWEHRVRTDRRAGMAFPVEGALDLRKAAKVLAVGMLAGGVISLPSSRARRILEEKSIPREHLDAMVTRGILDVTESDHCEFFHQSFLEHAAARGMLDFSHGRGLELLVARTTAHPDDLLTVTVLEQALLVSDAYGDIREHANEAFQALLHSPRSTLQSAAITVYARIPSISQDVIRYAASAMEAPVVADRFISSIASVRAGNMARLFDHLREIWTRAINDKQRWHNCDHILRELPVIAARGGAAAALVRCFLDDLQVLDSMTSTTLGAGAAPNLLIILLALAPHDTQSWHDIVALCHGTKEFPTTSTRISNVLRGLARESKHFGRNRIAHDFLGEIGLDLTEYSADIGRAWGTLWAAEWGLRGCSIQEILDELRATEDDRIRRSMLNALRLHLSRATDHDAAEVWREFLSQTERSMQAIWCRIVWQDMMENPEDGAAMNAIGRMIADVLAAPDTDGVLSELLAKSVRTSLPDVVVRPLLADERVTAVDRWLDPDDLGLLLPIAYLRGHTSAVEAMRILVNAPSTQHTEVARIVVNSPILRVEAEPAAIDTVLSLAIRREKCALLLRMLKAKAPQEQLMQHRLALVAMARRLIDSNAGSERRLGYRLWVALLNRGLTSTSETPTATEILSRFASEPDVPSKAVILSLLAILAERTQLATVTNILEPIAASGDVHFRTQALNGLFLLARRFGLIHERVPELLELVIGGEHDSISLQQVAWWLEDLVPDHMDIANAFVRRFLTSPAVTQLKKKATRQLRGRLIGPLRAWTAVAPIENRRDVLELVNQLDPRLADLVINAVCSDRFGEIQPQLVELMKSPDVPAKTKGYIQNQLRLHSPLETGNRWTELELAMLDQPGATPLDHANLLAPPRASVTSPPLSTSAMKHSNLPALPPVLRESFRKCEVGLVVGSGVSLGSDVEGGFPGWTNLPERLLDAVEHVGGLDPATVRAKRSAFADKRKPGSYWPLGDMLREFDALVDVLRRYGAYSQTLSDLFRPQNAKPGKLHQIMVGLDVPFIATTNYDQLIELADSGRLFTPYTWKTSANALSDLNQKRRFLYKIHGTAELEDTVVLGREDYTLLQNDATYSKVMQHIAQSTHLLFVGFGMNDPYDLECLLENNASSFGSAARTHYALMYNPDYKRRDDLQSKFKVTVLAYDDHAKLPSILRKLAQP